MRGGVCAYSHAAVTLGVIPHSRPRFDGETQRAISQLLASGQVTSGVEVAKLESALCQQVGRRCAVAVDSGTSALALALRLWRAEGGRHHRVGIPAFACGSLYHAVRSAGWQPVVMDCDAATLTLHQGALDQARSLEVVIVAHPLGWAEPMVAAPWPCRMIEDIAQSAGAVGSDGSPLGRCGEIAIASFHATKPWGGAYGGALLLDDDAQAARVRRMIDPDGEVGGAMGTADADDDDIAHHQLSDLHALLARMRIAQFAALQLRRQAQFGRIRGWLEAAGARVLQGEGGNYFRLLMCGGRPAADLVAAFRSHGVAAALPIKQPLSRLTGEAAPGAEAAFARWLSLPLLADMSDAEQQQMDAAIRQVLG
ncbi:MAG: DegT/DnrJ/EryC1/StrS family aminotransferase [Mariprofundales bacterium]|nr:DegT/DnrJ/EryC1/StrS family aminotransferase [Mariprofundales bacterium]